MSAVFLLTVAATLGAVAFFEPCAIATHTLFSVRAHRQTRARCCHGLLALWLSRALLSTGLLSAVTFVGFRPWSPPISAFALAAMATLYLASRFFYIPVPHVEFFKLLPARWRLSHAVRLGLTLPACALPLLGILAAAVGISGSIPVALFAGLLFATLFTLPTALFAIIGVGTQVQRALRIAAIAAPGITAALLYIAAAYSAFYSWPK